MRRMDLLYTSYKILEHYNIHILPSINSLVGIYFVMCALTNFQVLYVDKTKI